MEALWAVFAVFAVIAVLLFIAVYFTFLRRRTVVGRLERKVKGLQDKDIKLEEELELRKMKKELEESIAAKEKEIDELKR